MTYVNNFRAKLMNLAYTNTAGDYIPYNYVPVTLATPLQDFYNLLFPVGTDRANIILRTNAYTMLMYAADLTDVFTKFDPRITYTLADINTFKSIPTSFSLPALAASTIGAPASLAMLNYGPSDPYYVGVYDSGKTSLEQLAGLIANYSYKLS